MNFKTDTTLKITASGLKGGRRLIVRAIAFVLSVHVVMSMLPSASVQAATSAGVIPSFSNVSMIACGGYHGLALKTDGTVWAWGRNDQGQLGDGTTTNRSSPVRVEVSAGNALSNVVFIAGGNLHSLAVKSDGTVWAWGYNASGQLGNTGDCLFSKTRPVQVSNLTNGLKVAGGFRHSLFLRTNQSQRATGMNSDGQLGDGTTTDACDRVTVSGSLNASAIASGSVALHSVMLVGSNVYTWGDNSQGQLGNGTLSDSTTPVQVSNISTAIAIAAGAQHTLAVLNDNTVRAWGENGNGQLGDGSTTDSTTPVTVSGLGSVTQVAGGSAHSVARKADNTAWAWGWNFNGQLGDGSTTQRTTPVQVTGLSGVTVVAVASGNLFSMALSSAGTVYTWGDNSNGELGR